MPKQILLPNGCKCSYPSVFPSNWKNKTANVRATWYISYWFYAADYNSKINPKAKKQVQIKGMNEFAILGQKQKITEELLDNELRMLQEEGYNPITGQATIHQWHPDDIMPETPFIAALEAAFKKIKGVPGTLADIKSTLKGVSQAADALRYSKIPVGNITRKHITLILEKCAELNPKFTHKRHNKYRAWLMKLFKYLSRLDAVSHNPVLETEKMVETKEIREILTREQRIRVDRYLREKQYYFWRLMIMFFHSGSREIELMSIRTSDVDLASQRFKCLIRKGKQYTWVWRPIVNSALELWKEVLSECQQGQYLFSEGLRPGNKKIRPDQIGRRWNLHVKKKLGITADFYSLKHSNSTAIAGILSDQDAARMNGHKSTAMVVGIYDVERSDRQLERIKKVDISFA